MMLRNKSSHDAIRFCYNKKRLDRCLLGQTSKHCICCGWTLLNVYYSHPIWDKIQKTAIPKTLLVMTRICQSSPILNTFLHNWQFCSHSKLIKTWKREIRSHMTRHSGTEHLEVFENQTKNVDFPTLDKHSNNHLLKVDTEEEE